MEIEFHKHMMPFLLQVAGKEEFYTSYSLQYVLPMKCQYAPRLYELLKSYQKNNIRWYFEIDELKKRLNCEKYKRFPDFRRRVLEPSVEEINRYTDIKVAYRTELTGRKTTHVVFGMLRKTQKELTETKKFIVEELDGELDLLSLIEESNNDPLNQFFAEHAKKVRAEREETGKEENGCGEE